MRLHIVTVDLEQGLAEAGGKQVSGTLVTVSDSTADIITCGDEPKHEDPKTRAASLKSSGPSPNGSFAQQETPQQPNFLKYGSAATNLKGLG